MSQHRPPRPRAAGLAAVVAAAALAGAPAGAQRVAYGVAGGVGLAGPSGAKRVSPDPYPVTGAGQPGAHLRASAAVAVGRSPLSVRAEAFYNRLRSGPNTYSGCCGPVVAKAALRDEALGALGTLVLTARRGAAVAPYALAGAGVVQTRLGSNPDARTTAVRDTRRATGPGVAAGAGVRVRVRGAAVLLEARYQQALTRVRGSAFVPLTAGLEF